MIQPLEQIEKLQSILLGENIHLFPQGIENSQEQIEEIIQILKEDQDFNDNLHKELLKFLSINSQQFKSILDYDTYFQIYNKFDEKLVQYNQFQEKIQQAQKKITESQRDVAIMKGYIQNNLIRDQDRIQMMEIILVQLNEHKAQAIQQIYNLENLYFSQMQSFNNPPLQVIKVAEIIILFLFNSSQSSWMQFKRLIADPNQFTARLLQFRIEEVLSSSLAQARIAFEILNSDLCQRSNWGAYILHKWIEHQFQIIDILNTNKEGLQELSNHQKALKFYENIEELKLKIYNLEENLEVYQNYQKPLMQDQEVKAEKVIASVKWFSELQSIVKPKQYLVKFTNYIIQFLESQECSQAQIFVVHIMRTDKFRNYTILDYEPPEQPYIYPLIINQFFDKNDDIDLAAEHILQIIQNPIQFYYNLKQLNSLIDKTTQQEEIHSLVYQMYQNEKTNCGKLLKDILMIIHQAMITQPIIIELNLHSILKIMNDNAKQERKALMGIIQHINEKFKINIQHQPEFYFDEISLINYLIYSYSWDNQNKSELDFNQQQEDAIQDLILKEKMEIDETIKNIIENYEIIERSKEYYNEVNKRIENIKFKTQENKHQIVSLKNQILEYNQFYNILKVPYQDLFQEKNLLENQLNILKDIDIIIKEQIDKAQKSINKPIHHGIKSYELGLFKSLSKFNPIIYFASKITLIQQGIYEFTPDMIKKYLGSHSSWKQITNLTINHINENQFELMGKLLKDFNDQIKVSQFQTKSIQNLIKRPYRIFHQKRLQLSNSQLIIQRSYLMQKQRVIKNQIKIINSIIEDLDQQVIQKIQDRIQQISKNLQLCEAIENKAQKIVDYQDLQIFQEFLIHFQQFDSFDLSIKLINKNQQLISKQHSKFNLFFIYIQDQYQNCKLDEVKGLFDQFEMPILVDTLNIIIGIYSYQLFYNEFGKQVQAICIQPQNNLLDHESNTNYQIRVLYEILCNKYRMTTFAMILQFLQQVTLIKQNISSIFDVVEHQINIDTQNQIQFNEFQQEVQQLLNCKIKGFIR